MTPSLQSGSPSPARRQSSRTIARIVAGQSRPGNGVRRTGREHVLKILALLPVEALARLATHWRSLTVRAADLQIAIGEIGAAVQIERQK